MMRRLIGAALLALALPGTARAEWVEAQSPHFVVYADDNRANVQRFSQELEKFHAALEFVMGLSSPPPSPSNRVTVYIVGSERMVQKLLGEGSKFVNGFYIPRAGGSAAFIPPVVWGSTELSEGKRTLLHEYVHHFMASNSGFLIPRWYGEGSAEFFSSAAFPKNGGVSIGMAANHRAAELFLAANVTVPQLLDPEAYKAARRGRGYDEFYGKSWALVHYLTFEPSRKGQLTNYLQLLAKGTPLARAATEAFGDTNQLNKDIEGYLNRSRIKMLTLPPDLIKVAGESIVRPLTAGEAAVMPLVVQSKRGVDEDEAKALVPQVRAVAARFPGEAMVQSALAEAEHDTGNEAAAIAAADAALAIDPRNANALVQKGKAMMALAQDEGDAAGFEKARKVFVALNRLENDHPLSLQYYFETFALAGVKPPPIAVQGLQRASDLAPFDLPLRVSLAQQLLRNGESALARYYLAPVAYNPHGGGLAEYAQQMIAKIDADPKWDGSGLPPPDGATEAEE